MSRAALLTVSSAGLRAAFDAGHPVDPTALDDTWYRGISLGLWGWVEALTWKTFAKTFHRDPDTGELRGWNVRLHQDGIEAEPRPKQRAGAPFTFGHYRVVGQGGELVLDYRAAGNPLFDPSARVVDPVVALAPGDMSRLLGRSLVALGPWRVPTPSYFLLERAGPLPFVVHPPRSPRRAPAPE